MCLSYFIFLKVFYTLLIISLGEVIWFIKVFHSLLLHVIRSLRKRRPSNAGTLSHISISINIVKSLSAFIWRSMLKGYSWLRRIKIPFCISECSFTTLVKKFRSCGGFQGLILLHGFWLSLVSIWEHGSADLVDIRCGLLHLRKGLYIMLVVVTKLHAILNNTHNSRHIIVICTLNRLATIQIFHQLIL